MNEISSVGKILDYDPSENKLTIRLFFLNPILIQEIINHIKSDSNLLIKIVSSNKDLVLQDKQRRRWYQIITKIIKSKLGLVSIDKVDYIAYHNDFKESLFESIVNSDGIEVVPSINDIPIEILSGINEYLIDRYTKLGIDFSNIV